MYRLGSTVITIQQIFSAGKYYKIYDFYNMIGLVSVRFGQKFWPNQTFFYAASGRIIPRLPPYNLQPGSFPEL